ncbi:MAG TPA: uroporphyrinogen-III synthase [Blastocatellia bacterium]|nr:uroporphyrinogen-III synthase [Blastocatellia bacterium]
MSGKKDGLSTYSGSQTDGDELARRRLQGRTILITRSPAQSGEITSLFEALGAQVIHLPTIEIVEPASWDAVDRALQRMETYDWLVFTSPNAVRSFFGRMKDRTARGDVSGALPKICAIGPATAKAVEETGARIDITPSESKAEGVLRALVECIGGQARVRGLRFLVPRSQIAREELPDGLARLGAIVDAVEAYRTIKPETDCEPVRRRLREGSIHAITFTSPSTIINFAGLLDAGNLSDLIGPALVGCIGPTTAAAAKEYGLRTVIQPERYNASALVEAMARSLMSETSEH